jgi:hypothetical protein
MKISTDLENLMDLANCSGLTGFAGLTTMKSEIRNKFQIRMAKNRIGGLHLVLDLRFGALNLFRISKFEFRVFYRGMNGLPT